MTTVQAATKARGDALAAPVSKAQQNALGQKGNVEYPSTQQDINSILEPYVKELQNLGPEYQKEMDYLAPYISGTTPTGLASAPAYNGPDAAVVNQKQDDLMSAEHTTAEGILNQPKPGFGGLAKAAGQYEQTILPSSGIQSALAYQKYLETYGGMQAPTADWSTQQKDAYEAILGNTASASSSGLPSVADEAAGNQAQTNANDIQSQLTQAGANNLSGGGNTQ